MTIPKNFEWTTYLKLNPDLPMAGIGTKEDAEKHYMEHGIKENRTYTNRYDPIVLEKSQKIVNTYHNGSHSGIGDFLRGSIYLYELCHKYGCDFNVSLNNHDIGQYISTNYINSDHTDVLDISIETEKQHGLNYRLDHMYKILKKALQEEKRQLINSMYSDLLRSDKFSDMHGLAMHQRFQNHSITSECSNFFQQNIIFSQLVEDNFLDIKKINNINNDYIAVHCRFGDFKIMQKDLSIKEETILQQTNFKQYNSDLDSIVFDMIKYQHKHKLPVFILCDDDTFKQYAFKIFCQYGIQDKLLISHHNSNHSSSHPGLLYHYGYKNHISKEQMLLIALDLKILSKAKHIYSYSVYPWGSGFSYSIAKIYNIPITINIINNE